MTRWYPCAHPTNVFEDILPGDILNMSGIARYPFLVVASHMSGGGYGRDWDCVLLSPRLGPRKMAVSRSFVNWLERPGTC